MKIQCATCGVHFSNEYIKTLTPECFFWATHGAKDLPEKIKKRTWDWIFFIDTDQLLGDFKMNFAFSFQFLPVKEEDLFKNIVPNWENMTENEQQQYEREYFKDKFVKNPTGKVAIS